MADLAEQLNNYRELGFDLGDVPLAELRATAGQRTDVVLVLPHALVPVQEWITRLRLPGKSRNGVVADSFDDPDRYHPVESGVPRDRPYLVSGFEPGLQYLNVPPRDAVPRIRAAGRLPATIEEGLAAFTANPAVLRRLECFSLAGSTRGDKRVPALWVSANAPKLGWCFAGAPHTWLGTASVAARIVPGDAIR